MTKTFSTSMDTGSRSRGSKRLLKISSQYEGYLALAMGEGSDDEEHELFPLKAAKPKENLIERTLQSGDTLQSIALKYHVPVAELKRLNNIHRDNEIHARITVKIPIRPISCLVDLTPVHGEQKTMADGTLSINSGSDPEEFLVSVDRRLAQIRDSMPQEANGSNAISTAVATVANGGDSPSDCSGADWGMNWKQIVFCTLLISIILPVVIWYKLNQHGSVEET